MSDHGVSTGERFGEHAYGAFCYDYTLRTFTYFLSSELSQLEIKQQTRTVDFMPTILDYLDIPQDPNFSKSWNEFYHYLFSAEFLSNIRKFSGVPVTKTKTVTFMLLTRGGYQLPHIHNVGPSTLIMMLYFSKNWKKGDPGGTYVTTEEDESKMVFEPYNLDNTAVIFHDGQHAGHGARYITKDVERRGIQLTYEPYSETDGWYGDFGKKVLEPIEL